VYKYGGTRNSVLERERLRVSRLLFLGIRRTDFGEGDGRGVSKLSGRDERKVEIMLTREWVLREPCVMYSPTPTALLAGG